jgi:hypothetical protein
MAEATNNKRRRVPVVDFRGVADGENMVVANARPTFHVSLIYDVMQGMMRAADRVPVIGRVIRLLSNRCQMLYT